MDLRKVQETGGSFFISLPRKWAHRCGLKKGSVIALIARTDGCIVVDPQYNFEKHVQKATIVPSPHLEREITGKYLLGSDTIKIKGRNRLPPEVSKIARKTARRLIGLEIVEEDAYSVLLNCILEPTSFPPEKVIRREYLFASDMHLDAITAFIEGNILLAKAIVKRDDEVDRLYFLLVRLIRATILNPRLGEKMNILPIDGLDYRLIASYIESIADYSCKIAEKIIDNYDIPIPKDNIQLLQRLGEQSYLMHKTAIQAFFTKDLARVENIINIGKQNTETFRELDKLLVGKSPKLISYISSVAAALEQICSYSIDIADIVMPR
jgi:phosphate uptake regulator